MPQQSLRAGIFESKLLFIEREKSSAHFSRKAQKGKKLYHKV
jgi:hypothetical protein